MATPLDAGLLSKFSIIFPFLLVFCIIYALLEKTKLFGENKGVQSVIALVFGILTILFPIVRETINTMAPWFVLLMFALAFILICFMIFGATEGDFMGVLKSQEFGYLNTWIVGIGIVIVIGSLLTVVSDFGGLGKTEGGGAQVEIGEQGTQEHAFWKTITHPKVLGLIIILLIAAMTVSRLALTT